jgi:hypothetical protein
MQVTLSEPSRASDLAQFLARHGAYVSHTNAGVIEVGFIGSLSSDCHWSEAERHPQS